MHTVKLRKVGGSIMFPIPKAFLDALGLTVASPIALEVNDGALVVTPQPRPAYRLADLLAQCDEAAPLTAEDAAWLRGHPIGRELL